jgi:Insertion element 4 transposase N-terminal
MARTIATLPAGSRITDYISLGVIAKFFPLEKVHGVLQRTGRASVRERDLPAHVVVYYVIALALYMRSSYCEVLRCLLARSSTSNRPGEESRDSVESRTWRQFRNY